jgi:hypothetical protein
MPLGLILTSLAQGVFCSSCFYLNTFSGYNNDDRLIGTWIGRASQGESIRANYRLRPRQRIGVELRHRKIDRQYLPQGGTQNDVAGYFSRISAEAGGPEQAVTALLL